jgi:hypothetical protein
MTLKGYFLWFKENWPKTGVIVAIFLTIYLIVLVLPKSTLLFALLLSTPLYMLHQADEYVIPGGFVQFMNHNIYKMDPETGLVDSTAVFWVNMLVWFFFSLASLNAVADLTQAAWMPYFYIFPGCGSSHYRDSWQTVSQPGHGFCLVGTCPVGDLDDLAVGSGRSDRQPVLE